MRRIVFNLFLLIHLANCIEKQTPKVKNLLPNFRRQVEEIPEEFTTEKSEDDANLNLVAFLVKNAKEIFGETEDNTDVVTKTSKITETTTFRQKTTLLKDRRTLPADRTFSDENTFLEQRPALEERTVLKEKTLTEEKIWPEESTFPIAKAFTEGVSIDEETFNKEGTLPEVMTSSVPFSKKTLFAVKSSKSLLRNLTTNTINDFTTVWSPSLSNPLGTISSTTTTTPTTTSIRYSLSSPLTSYLENTTTQSYKLPTRTTGIEYTINVESIKSDLLNITNVQIIEKGKKEPIMLTRKQDRIHDDISIYNVPVAAKEMGSLKRSCIACNNIQMHECNEPKNKIGILPKVQCADDEICGVKALKNKGYVWRGCLRSPLYNYWWSLCDSDLCNTDNIVSLYDEIR
ncbi:hypothetical protein RR46_06570 [Papilio xuthus]|uniref:Uncharacterized protein n=1 Tax=Papilio xuthus TaxID=66420 RepID=A0A194PN11_PAPXU|nr:hypothetical protein RR46_06570 [Papilio xuthus]